MSPSLKTSQLLDCSFNHKWFFNSKIKIQAKKSGKIEDAFMDISSRVIPSFYKDTSLLLKNSLAWVKLKQKTKNPVTIDNFYAKWKIRRIGGNLYIVDSSQYKKFLELDNLISISHFIPQDKIDSSIFRLDPSNLKNITISTLWFDFVDLRKIHQILNEKVPWGKINESSRFYSKAKIKFPKVLKEQKSFLKVTNFLTDSLTNCGSISNIYGSKSAFDLTILRTDNCKSIANFHSLLTKVGYKTYPELQVNIRKIYVTLQSGLLLETLKVLSSIEQIYSISHNDRKIRRKPIAHKEYKKPKFTIYSPFIKEKFTFKKLKSNYINEKLFEHNEIEFYINNIQNYCDFEKYHTIGKHLDKSIEEVYKKLPNFKVVDLIVDWSNKVESNKLKSENECLKDLSLITHTMMKE